MEKDAKKIIEIIIENLDTLTPRQISDFTVILSINFGRLGTESAKADMDYAKRWLEIKKTCETNAEAEMEAKATEEYHNKKRLEYGLKGLKETIQALKKRLAVMSDECRNMY